MLIRLIGFLFFLFFGIAFSSAGEIISAPQALEKMQSNELVLIDIRSPGEWKETGIAENAVALSMHEPGFLEGLKKIKSENPGKQIALICATGGRSAHVQNELEKRNLGTVMDVSEGMFGNQRGEGWLKRGFPITRIQ